MQRGSEFIVKGEIERRKPYF